MSDAEREDFIRALLARVYTLPLAQQEEAILDLVGQMLNLMPPESVAEVRAEIREQFAEGVPIVEQTLDLIDGHQALRAMGPLEDQS